MDPMQPASWILGALAIISLAILIVTKIYFNFRYRYGINVSCWFCNAVSKVAYHHRNSWDCKSCEQYNGFLPDGGYNKVIYAQHDAHFNPAPAPRPSPAPASDNGLCDSCNGNQRLKVQQLASFRPRNVARYDDEVETYQRELERAYALCPRCDKHLRDKLGAEKAWLLGLKLELLGQVLEVKAPSSSTLPPLLCCVSCFAAGTVLLTSLPSLLPTLAPDTPPYHVIAQLAGLALTWKQHTALLVVGTATQVVAFALKRSVVGASCVVAWTASDLAWGFLSPYVQALWALALFPCCAVAVFTPLFGRKSPAKSLPIANRKPNSVSSNVFQEALQSPRLTRLDTSHTQPGLVKPQPLNPRSDTPPVVKPRPEVEKPSLFLPSFRPASPLVFNTSFQRPQEFLMTAGSVGRPPGFNGSVGRSTGFAESLGMSQGFGKTVGRLPSLNESMRSLQDVNRGVGRSPGFNGSVGMSPGCNGSVGRSPGYNGSVERSTGFNRSVGRSPGFNGNLGRSPGFNGSVGRSPGLKGPSGRARPPINDISHLLEDSRDVSLPHLECDDEYDSLENCSTPESTSSREEEDIDRGIGNLNIGSLASNAGVRRRRPMVAPSRLAPTSPPWPLNETNVFLPVSRSSSQSSGFASQASWTPGGSVCGDDTGSGPTRPNSDENPFYKSYPSAARPISPSSCIRRPQEFDVSSSRSLVPRKSTFSDMSTPFYPGETFNASVVGNQIVLSRSNESVYSVGFRYSPPSPPVYPVYCATPPPSPAPPSAPAKRGVVLPALVCVGVVLNVVLFAANAGYDVAGFARRLVELM